MPDVIHSILSDAAVRNTAAIQQLCVNQALASPWVTE